jgi:hypothetical protein
VDERRGPPRLYNSRPMRIAAVVLSTVCLAQSALAEQAMVVFAVEGRTMQPIVMVVRNDLNHETRFMQPPAGFDDIDKPHDAASAAFAKRYYAKGRTYRMLYGGAAYGFAQVQSQQMTGCISLAAKVTTSKPLPDGISALAIGSFPGAPRALKRRDMTDAEEKTLFALAQQVYATKGVPSALMKGVDIAGDTATDLDNDGKIDLIATFIAQDEKHPFIHRLFLVASPDDLGGARVEYAWYYRGERANDADQELFTFVDHLDFDGDGTDELIVQTRGYETTEFVILQRDRFRNWNVVYSGGESGC